MQSHLNEAPAVVLNPAHGTWLGDRVLATQIPAGFWAVKVRSVGDEWVAFAVPRKDTVEHPFPIARGTDERLVRCAGSQWRDSAVTGVHRMDRVVFAGLGDATFESKPNFDPAELLAGVA